jgi:hypothetical protein
MRTISHFGRPILVAVLVSVFGCEDVTTISPTRTITGSGTVVEEPRTVTGFTGVSAETLGDVQIEIGAEEALTLRAEDNLLPYLITEVENGILRIWTETGVDLGRTQDIEIHVTATSVNSVVLTGVGDVAGADLVATAFSVVLSGLGGIELSNLDAEQLDVLIAGQGDVRLSGTVNEQTITISGVGDYEAPELSSADASVQIGGIGSATLRVSDQLTATITGSGSICYIGSPTVESTITGQGTVGPCGG